MSYESDFYYVLNDLNLEHVDNTTRQRDQVWSRCLRGPNQVLHVQCDIPDHFQAKEYAKLESNSTFRLFLLQVNGPSVKTGGVTLE